MNAGYDDQFKGASDSVNNQNVEMMEENKCNSSAAAGGDRQEEAGNGLDRLDLYHVELTGMCTD